MQGNKGARVPESGRSLPTPSLTLSDFLGRGLGRERPHKCQARGFRTCVCS
jgi:hypothetical protein